MLSPVRLAVRSVAFPKITPQFLRRFTLHPFCSVQHCVSAQVEPKKNTEHVYTFNLLKSIVKSDGFKASDYQKNTSSTLSILQGVNKGTLPVESLDSLPGKFVSEIAGITDQEIDAILSELKKCTSKNVIEEIVTVVNGETLKRMPNADPSVALSISLTMSELGVLYRSTWAWAALKRFCRRLDKLTSVQMLQIMYLVHVFRKFPAMYTAFDIQHQLTGHFDNLSLQEMGLVSIAFFKTKTKMNNKVIMSKIMRKLLEEAEACDDFSLAMLCKIIRYSMPLSLADELYLVQAKLAQNVDKFNLLALVQLALSGTNVLIYNEELISAIFNKLRGKGKDLRLKDMERLVLVMSMFNVKDDEFLNGVLKEVKTREDEIALYPKPFVSLVQYLNILQRFDYRLIDTVLSERFISDTYGKDGKSYRKISSEIIYIDSSVSIECPDYSGSRLPPKIVTTSAKITNYIAQETVSGTQKFSFELEDALRRNYGGNDNVSYTKILPHYQYPEFILGFDERLTPQTVPEDWRVHQWGVIKRPPNDQFLWMAVVIGGWNMVIRNKNQPLGSLVAKLRQLRILGFHPVVVSYSDWRATPDKDTFLKQLIGGETKKAISGKKV